MRSLYKYIIPVLTLVIALPCFSATTSEIKQLITNYAREMDVEPSIMLSLANVESGFRQEARGYSGNVGIFQILPSTAKGLGYDAYDLEQNIKCGILYYKNLYKIFGSAQMALAAYNSGPGAVKRCNCIPAHSQKFVNKVISDSNYFKLQP